jgi:chromosome segregation ATPase
MADKMQYARSIKNLAAMYKDMVAAADALEQLGSVEQAIEDGKRIIAGLIDETKKMKVEKEAAKVDLDAFMVDAAQTKADTEVVARDVRAEIISGAQVDAAEIVKKAQDDAAKLMADASTEKARLSSEIGGLQKATADLRTEIVSLNNQRDDALAQAADAQKKLDGLKDKFKSLLG